MDIATPDGGSLHVEVMGDGEPVVLLSGVSQDHTALAAQFELADEFRLVCPDKRGTGRSSDLDVERARAGEPFTCGDFADDVVTVLKALDVPRAHIVGFSMGGRIAQWIAIRFPKRVGALVLLATSMGDAHGTPRTPETDRAMNLANPADLALLNYSSTWMAAHPDEVRALHASHTERAAQRTLQMEAVHHHDAWAQLPRVKAPTLVVHGTDDRINPPNHGQLLAERIPGATLVEVEGGRHGVAAEFADVVNPLIRDFLRAHPLA